MKHETEQSTEGQEPVDSEPRMTLPCRASQWGRITPGRDVTVVGLRVEQQDRFRDRAASVRLCNGCTGEWVAAPLWKWQRGLNPNMRVMDRQDVNVEIEGGACSVELILKRHDQKDDPGNEEQE